MQNSARRVIVAVTALLALITVLTACTGSTRTVTVIKTVTATPAQTAVPSIDTAPAPQTPNKQLHDQALAYLQAKDRAAKFKNVVTQAGIKIAQALQAGKFGPVSRYDGDKKPLQPGYVGEGGIEAKSGEAFAWVYWNADGSINYSKPITQISLRYSNNNSATDVMILGPQPPLDKNDDLDTYWTVYKSTSKDFTEVGDLTIIDDPDMGTQTPMQNGGYEYPYTLDDLKQLDIDALAQMKANLISQFGAEWYK